jgi:hypothetical protein
MSIEKIKPSDMTFDVLMHEIKEGHIKIPDFQREFVWERSQILSLLDSIYNHYPIGSLIFWESEDNICSHRNIGNIDLKKSDRKLINYVLDGQQRITSLYASLEEAEIKVKIQGKTKIIKLQIYFDLDKEEFVTSNNDVGSKFDKKTRYIWQFPTKGKNYLDNIILTLNEINKNTHSIETITQWFSKEFKIVEYNAKYYSSSLLQKLQLIELNNDILKLSYLGEELIETKNKDIIIKSLIRNVAYFTELLDKVLTGNEYDMSQLLDYLNEVYEVGWDSLAQIKSRIKWLWKLGYGDYSSKKFTIKSDRIDHLKQILNEEIKLEQGNESNLNEELKLISIKDIIDEDEALELISKLTEKRKEAFKLVRKRFRNYKFSVVYILDQPIGTVVNIFERINTSGQVLKLVDLMIAKTWSPNFNLRNKLHDFLKELKQKNYGEISDVIILQCLSTNFQKECKRKDILELSREQIISIWDETIESIKKSIDFLKNELNITNSKILPFGSLIVPLSYFFYKLGNKDETSSQKENLIEWFWKASISNRFDSAVEGRIAEDIKNIMLPNLSNEKIKFNYTMPVINEDKIINQKYSLGSAFSKTIMCLFAYNKPKHFENNKLVSFGSFSKFNSLEFHHIFPKNYLKKDVQENYDLKDSIANISFVPAGANKFMRDNPPNVYLDKLNNPELEKTFETHIIPKYKNSGLLENDFNKFSKYRANAIKVKIKSIVGDLTDIEKGMYESEEKQIDIFENKIRTKIDEILIKNDLNYWENTLSDEFKIKINERINQYLVKHPNKKIDDIKKIDFCVIMDYFRIIKMNWIHFEPYFKSKTELEKHFLNINEFRNSIKHSREVDLTTKKLAEGSLIWFEQLLRKR